MRKIYPLLLSLFSLVAFGQNTVPPIPELQSQPRPMPYFIPEVANPTPTVLVDVRVTPSPGKPGAPLKGIVTLNQPAPHGGARIGLAVEPTDGGAIPRAVTVREGETTATFEMTVDPAIKPVMFQPEVGLVGIVTVYANYHATVHQLVLSTVTSTVAGAAIPPAKEGPRKPMATTGLGVLPWNGHEAALTLTFDDALPAHIAVVAPALAAKNIKATYYLPVMNAKPDVDKWKKIAAEGNEIGNHTVSHLSPDDLTDAQLKAEYDDAKDFLEKEIGVSVTTSAYPFSMAPPRARLFASEVGFAARDWNNNEQGDYMAADQPVDWFNIPSRATGHDTIPADILGWLEADQKLKSWVVLQIHGIHEGGYEPIPMETWMTIVNHTAEVQNNGSMWVAPFRDVAAYWRAQDIVERSKYKPLMTEVRGGEYAWDIPSYFPQGVVLKMRADKATKLFQGGKQLKADKNGVYSVQFDLRSLDVVSPI